MASQPVVVIGAGPAGLTTAYELGKKGVSSLILEAGKQVGGISQTVNYRDFRFDIGGHRFFSKVPIVNDLWHEILGDNFLLRPGSPESTTIIVFSIIRSKPPMRWPG